MSDYNEYEQYANEKKLARLKRQRQGADMSRDHAEERHDAIFRMVWRARFWVPVGFAVLVGWIGRPEGLVISVVGVLASFWFSVVLAGIAEKLLGVFHRNTRRNVGNFVLMAGGVVMVLIGLGFGAIGVALSGAGVVVTPWLWTKWGRSVMGGTDFSRHFANPAAPAAPRIIE